MVVEHLPNAGLQGQPTGAAYWVTGLPGAGKTTLASRLAERIASQGRSVVQLDGDRMRVMLGGGYGYSRRDRHALAEIYARACQEFSRQGHDVVCATVSMFHDVRRWSRANIAGYCEIYLQAPIELLAERHPKGLYAAALAGRIRNVPGVDLELEVPEAPDLRIDLDRGKSPSAVADELFKFLGLNAEDAHAVG